MLPPTFIEQLLGLVFLTLMQGFGLFSGDCCWSSSCSAQRGSGLSPLALDAELDAGLSFDATSVLGDGAL